MFALCVEKFQYFFSGLTEIDLNKGLNMASANFHAPYLLHPFEQLFLCDEGNRSVRPKKEKKNFSLFFACNSMLQNRSSHSPFQKPPPSQMGRIWFEVSEPSTKRFYQHIVSQLSNVKRRYQKRKLRKLNTKLRNHKGGKREKSHLQSSRGNQTW